MLTLKDRNALVKSWLWRYRERRLDLRRLQYEYVELVSVQESVRAVNYDGMPHSGKIPDLSDLIISRDRILERLIKAQAELTKAFNEISEAVSGLESAIERDVISARYLQLKEDCSVLSMDEIARKLNYSSSLIKVTHGTALSDLVPIINTLYPDNPIPEFYT